MASRAAGPGNVGVSSVSLLRELGATPALYVVLQTVAGIVPAGFVLLIAAAVSGRPPAVSSLMLIVVGLLLVGVVADALSPGLRAQLLDRSGVVLDQHWVDRTADWPQLSVFESPILIRQRSEAERAVLVLQDTVVYFGFIANALASVVPVAIASFNANPVLTIAVLVGDLPLAFGLAHLYRRAWDARTLHAPLVLRGDALKEVATDPRSAKDLRAFQLERLSVARWGRTQHELLTALGVIRLRASLRILLGALMGTSVVVLAIGLTLATRQSAQHLAVVIGLFIQASGSLGLLVQASVELAEKRRSLGRYLTFVNAAPDSANTPPAGSRRQLLGTDHLTFTYPGSSRPALRDISCAFTPGALNLVVGPNGGGKSSLIKVLTGLYLPDAGTTSMASVTDRTVLHQDFARFPLTIRENLEADEPQTDKQLWSILDQVGLDHAIRTKPTGLDTPLYRDSTTRASDLSGGQWQRLAIARTLLRARRTSIVILDEPTSALDANAEIDMLELLIRELSGKTIVLVTHRLQWAKHAASVVEITDAEHCRTATHQELLHTSDWYRTAYLRQSQAFD